MLSTQIAQKDELDDLKKELLGDDEAGDDEGEDKQTDAKKPKHGRGKKTNNENIEVLAKVFAQIQQMRWRS